MAYVPFQQYGDLYDETRALEAGTLFADLDKPFTGKVNTL
ncbi:MAG: spore coat associated protein CotJA [Acutalibacteraceae bacterium]